MEPKRVTEINHRKGGSLLSLSMPVTSMSLVLQHLIQKHECLIKTICKMEAFLLAASENDIIITVAAAKLYPMIVKSVTMTLDT